MNLVFYIYDKICRKERQNVSHKHLSCLLLSFFVVFSPFMSNADAATNTSQTNSDEETSITESVEDTNSSETDVASGETTNDGTDSANTDEENQVESQPGETESSTDQTQTDGDSETTQQGDSGQGQQENSTNEPQTDTIDKESGTEGSQASGEAGTSESSGDEQTEQAGTSESSGDEQTEQAGTSETSGNEQTGEDEPNKEESTVIFKDVQTDYWAIREINFLQSLSIINGYDREGYFEFLPDNQVTRAQAAKMIVKALGEEELIVEQASFPDVQPGEYWASGWIERANQLGIFTGYENGQFGSEDLLTRAQMSKVIAKAFDLESFQAASEEEPIFSDVEPNYWALSYINTLYYNGISNGNNNRFMPDKDITRAQFSALLTRTINDDFRIPIVGTVIATGRVTAETYLNVRSEPATDAEMIGKLSPGETVPIYSIDGYWAKINFQNQVGYVHKSYLKINNVDDNQLEGRIIVLDAGHGGKDPGTSGYDATEKEIVLKVVTSLQSKLTASGATVIMTRIDDTFQQLEERVQIAEDNFAEIFVSVHVNSAANEKAMGTETYYDTSSNDNGTESYKLAEEIQTQIVQSVSMYDRGTKDKGFHVLRNNNIPSVLIEMGFLSNEEDAIKLLASDADKVFADAIYEGILAYYEQ